MADVIGLKLQAGPFVRLLALDTVISVDNVTLRGDFALDRVTSTSGTVTRIAAVNVRISADQTLPTDTPITNPGFESGQGALFLYSGAKTGVAGTISGRIAGSIGGFTGGATVGVSFNTTNTDINETVTIGSTTLTVKLPRTPVFTFELTDVEFNFGGILQVRGNFTFAGDNVTATGVDIFVGHTEIDPATGQPGSFKLDDGSLRPGTIGVLISNATLVIQKYGTGSPQPYALYANGSLKLVGLDGLQVSGNVTFKVNTGTVQQTLAIPNRPAAPRRRRSTAARSRSSPPTRTSAWPACCRSTAR